MNSGIVISFIIGGLLLISIISLNARVIENSGETVLNVSAKQNVETVTQIMTRDFLRVGYNTGEKPTNAIKETSANAASGIYKIKFEADMDDDNNTNPVTITWEWRKASSQKATFTDNPNDYKLIRTVSDGSEPNTTFAVTDFKFTFLDGDGNTTATNTKIRSIRVSLECEAQTKYANAGGYEKSIWNKTFTPPNLNLGVYK